MERPERSSRRSARLKEMQRLPEPSVPKDRNTEPKYPLPSSTSKTPKPLRKRRRTGLAGAADTEVCEQEVTSDIRNEEINPVEYWRENGRWPVGYAIQDDQTRKDFRQDLGKDSCGEEDQMPEMGTDHLVARKKSSSSIRGKQSETTSVIIRGMKLCWRPKVASFMSKSELGITDASKSLCRTMLEMEQAKPRDLFFRDDLFDRACEKLQDGNEARVIQDISRLIVPSAETLATLGAKHFDVLVESVDESWTNSIPVTETCPQPDYSVGFRREAFAEDQLNGLGPFVGELTDTSFFVATYYMYFPFLRCEVKSGATTLDIADRQNAHSITIAARGVVELFRLARREKELHREIVAFSISHDNRMVRIYGHYPLIDGDKTSFYRHPIRDFSFTEQDGREKWSASQFTRNVYEIWMPAHLSRICSVVDDLPRDLLFDVSP